MCRNLVCVGRPDTFHSGIVLFTATVGLPPSYGKQPVSRQYGLSEQKKDMNYNKETEYS